MIPLYHQLRRDVSLLLSEGHTEARNYVVAMVWSEARLVRQRIVAAHRTNAVMTQSAIVSVLSKKGGKNFQELLDKLDDGD